MHEDLRSIGKYVDPVHWRGRQSPCWSWYSCVIPRGGWLSHPRVWRSRLLRNNINTQYNFANANGHIKVIDCFQKVQKAYKSWIWCIFWSPILKYRVWKKLWIVLVNRNHFAITAEIMNHLTLAQSKLFYELGLYLKLDLNQRQQSSKI